jgi:hypothetical protein
MSLTRAESLKLLVCEPETHRPSRRLLAGVLIWTFVDLVALVLLCRRLTGAFPRHLTLFDFGWLLFVAAVLSCLACGLWLRDDEQDTPSRMLWRSVACLVPVIALSFALWPGRSIGALCTALVAWMVTACVAARPTLVFREGWLDRIREALVEGSRFLGESLPGASPSDEPAGMELEPRESADLRLERRTTSQGIEEIEGTAEARFGAGQKHCTLHIAFCPPFAERPTVELAAGTGLDAQVKAAAVYPYGVRIDVRRSGDAREAGVCRVEFRARATAVRGSGSDPDASR